jgi:RHS repeat-associated protein
VSLSFQAGPSNSVLYYSYAWDVAGNLTARAEWTLSVGETFTYDTTNRVTGSSIGGTAKSVSYDGDGNITYKSDVGTYNYNASGSAQPHAIQSITGTVNSGSGYVSNPSYSYDNNGNMLSGGGRSFTYTATNQVASIGLPGGGTISYQYDTFDQRYQQAAPEGTTVYWDAQGVTSEQYTAAGTGAVTWRSYLTAAGEKIGMMVQPSGGATTPIYFHSDHLGLIVALTNSAGTVIERDDYDPWGKRRNTNGADDPGDTLTSQTTRGYTGEEHVADVALINLNARMYDPQIGKFMGSDPLVAYPFSSQGWNRFAYANNNPLAYYDPLGLLAVQVGFGGGLNVPVVGVAFQVSFGFVADFSGNAKFYGTFGGVKGLGESYKMGVSIAGTDGDISVFDGESVTQSFIAGNGLVGGSIDYSHSVSGGGSLGFTVGEVGGLGYTAGITNTKLFGFGDIARAFSSMVGGQSGKSVAGGSGASNTGISQSDRNPNRSSSSNSSNGSLSGSQGSTPPDLSPPDLSSPPLDPITPTPFTPPSLPTFLPQAPPLPSVNIPNTDVGTPGGGYNPDSKFAGT